MSIQEYHCIINIYYKHFLESQRSPAEILLNKKTVNKCFLKLLVWTLHRTNS